MPNEKETAVPPVVQAENAKDNAVQQAQIWAQEARTQRETVLSILRHFGLPEHDWEALRLISEKVPAAAPVVQAVPADLNKLTRYDGSASGIGETNDIIEQAGGSYVLFRDVQTLLAAPSMAVSPAPRVDEWISVDERLPENTCLASYQPHRRGHKPRVIRAVYFKQYQIEASGEDGESTEYNEANDTEYIKAGWYERIDNWGDFASVAVCEGVVTHWMPLPSAPAIRSLRSGSEPGGEAS